MCATSSTTPSCFSLKIELKNEVATQQLAENLAPVLGSGDTLLLEGSIGAGKTAFARALIQSSLASAGAPPEDIPSPTFTLVQTYQAGSLEIWHADLYRLTHPSEIIELGLDEAFDHALCLIEWPQRLEDYTPKNALKLVFKSGHDEDARLLILSGPNDWENRLSTIVLEPGDA